MEKNSFSPVLNKENFNFSYFNYPYTDYDDAYGTEKLSISPTEAELLKKFLKLSEETMGKNIEIPSFFPKQLLKNPRKIIIDTDIGTDWDDVLALLTALHMESQDVQLLGITTNYHPTLLRKHVVESIISKAGAPYDKIKVVAGPSGLCGTHRPHFHHGNEGEGLSLKKKEKEKLWEINDSLEAIDFIYNTCKENPGEITIVSIGIPTNLGLCCYLHNDFEGLVGHIVVMGGGKLMKFSKEDQKLAFFELPKSPSEVFAKNKAPKIPGFHLFPNHNISGDTLASKFLFDSQCRISLIPHHITAQHWLEGIAVETLLHHGMEGSPLKNEIPVCGKLGFEWLSRRWGQRGQCVHDPLTVYEAVFIEDNGKMYFENKKSGLVYMRGTLLVHEWAGFSSFVANPTGRHRIAVEVKDPQAFLKWLEETLLKNVDEKNRVVKWCGEY